MKAHVIALLGAASLLALGCQRNAQMRAYIDLLGVEQRLLEDDLYEVYTQRRYLSGELKHAQKENETLRKRLGLAPTDPIVTTPSETLPATSGRDSRSTRPELESPEIEIPDAPRQLPNGARLPAETAPGDFVPAETVPADSLPGPGGAAMRMPVDEESYSPPEDLRVTHVVINPVLTTGHNFDRRPGDDGISVVFEPRNADDVFVPRAGDISIVLLDPEEDGEAQRVARWDFPLDEATHRIRTEKFGQGLSFKLPWPEQPPNHNRLHVFVRYTSDDGRVLEDNHQIEFAEQGEFSNRWTPKSVQPVSDPGNALKADSVRGDATNTSNDRQQRIPFELPAPRNSSERESLQVQPDRSASPRTSAPEVIPAPKTPAWSPDRP